MYYITDRNLKMLRSYVTGNENHILTNRQNLFMCAFIVDLQNLVQLHETMFIHTIRIKIESKYNPVAIKLLVSGLST